MCEELQKIHDKLIECKLGDEVRVSIMHLNSPQEYLVCFLKLTDRFENFDDLLIAIKKCLDGLNIKINQIEKSKITITLNKK